MLSVFAVAAKLVQWFSAGSDFGSGGHSAMPGDIIDCIGGVGFCYYLMSEG